VRRPPPPELLALLAPIERAGFWVGDFFARHLGLLGEAWNTVVLGVLIWFSGGRRIDCRGMQHVADLDRSARVLLVANHRSYFDFFVIAAMCFWHSELSKRILFPVRSTFFYERPLGIVVNVFMSAMTMFPPVLRDREKLAFNRYSLDRCVDELAVPGTVMGIHPEGTRNKTDDPYAFLRAQPGVGRVILEASEEVRVHPVFITGIANDLLREMRYNWLAPRAHPIDILFGPAIDFTDLRQRGNRASTQLLAAQRCVDHIKALAEQRREIAASRAERERPADVSR